MISDKKRPVSVEDLLRLKRFERPSSEFWADFDRQLREKQLIALVGKRPWWKSLRLVDLWSGLRRLQVPLGASAIVAITLVSYRGDSPEMNRPEVADPQLKIQQIAELAPGLQSQPAPTEGGGQVLSAVADSAVISGVTERVESAVEPAHASVVAEGIVREIPLFGSVPAEGREHAMAWASRYDQATVSVLDTVEPPVARPLLSTPGRFESRGAPVRATIEPLHQITPPAERRGTRILTAMVSMGSVENAMRATERAANRLSEEQLYDQIHRFGARGAGVNVKF